MWTNKEEVLTSLKDMIKTDPTLADQPTAKGNGRVFTMAQMIEEIENETADGKSMLEAALSDDGDCDESCGCDHG